MCEIFETIHNSRNQRNYSIVNVINDAFKGVKNYETEKEENLNVFEKRS